jgi:[ribosomal protein S5]-alanine N-acetyltransferase
MEGVMSLDNIETDRLLLIPVTYEITKGLSIGSVEEVEKLGIRTNGKWPRQDTMDILPFVNKDFEKCDVPTGFEFWMILTKDNRTVIGDIGFRGIPDEKGEVEIGYGLIEEVRGKGYGTEALVAMVNWAFAQDKVKCIKADCLINNFPSLTILQKSGFKEIKRDDELVYWKNFKI